MYELICFNNVVCSVDMSLSVFSRLVDDIFLTHLMLTPGFSTATMLFVYVDMLYAFIMKN